jgi:hypothetical protein
MLFSERDGFAAKTRENQRRCVDATTAAVSGRPGEVEVEMACMDADVDYDDVCMMS